MKINKYELFTHIININVINIKQPLKQSSSYATVHVVEWDGRCYELVCMS